MNDKNKSNLLYTVRNFYENKSKTGIMLTLTAKDGRGEYHSIKAYVPYRSNYENSPKAEKLLQVNGGGPMARINVYTERQFTDPEDDF